MSSKLPKHKDRHERRHVTGDDEVDTVEKHRHHHHHRNRRHHHSRSRSRSPRNRPIKEEKLDKDDTHSRDRDRKPLKHSHKDQESEGKTKWREEDDSAHHQRHKKKDKAEMGIKQEDTERYRRATEEAVTMRGKWDMDSEVERDGPRDSRRRRRSGEGNLVRVKQEPHDYQPSRHDSRQKPGNSFEVSSQVQEQLNSGLEPPVPTQPKEQPNFAVSGKLTEDANTYRGVVIKYNEPPEARKPKRKWRFYVFKGDEELPVVHIHRQSAYLLGRERRIADLPIDHPSCSKQHAVLQYRLISYDRPDGTAGKRVRPYIIDLESSNGTYLNNKRIDAKRYYELQEKDVVKFGYSTREYVLLHDKSKDSDIEEDAGED